MKRTSSIIATLLLAGSLGASSTSVLAQEVRSHATLSSDSYCHLKFPAMREGTLSSSRPQLKTANEGDIVDFYGPCNYDPRGEDQVWQQKRHLAEEYEND